MCVQSKELQRNYFNALINDIERFISFYPNVTLYGLDIGGGTPTPVDAGIFAGFISWLSEFISDRKVTADFEPSIEGSFDTLVDDYWGNIEAIILCRQVLSAFPLEFNPHRRMFLTHFIEIPFLLRKCVSQ